MAGRSPPSFLIPLACCLLVLAACGSTSDAPPEDAAAAFRLDPQDFYPRAGARLGSHTLPEAPGCLRETERGFPSEGAFADCRRDLAVYQLALELWRGRVVDLVGGEARAKNERALATFACKLAGAGPCEPVGYGTAAAPVSQPRPPSCVGDGLPLALDDGGVGMENCRYGVTQYRDNLTEWARRAAYEARAEADARLEAAVDRFNCKLLAEPYRGVPCFPEGPIPVEARHALR